MFKTPKNLLPVHLFKNIIPFSLNQPFVVKTYKVFNSIKISTCFRIQEAVGNHYSVRIKQKVNYVYNYEICLLCYRYFYTFPFREYTGNQRKNILQKLCCQRLQNGLESSLRFEMHQNTSQNISGFFLYCKDVFNEKTS